MSFEIVLNSVQANVSSKNKQNTSQSPVKQIKKLKMELADRNFQIKKQEQDFAQEKAHLIQTHNQERSHLNAQIKQLKKKMREQNQCWEGKVDYLKQQKERQVRQVESKWQKQLNVEVRKQLKQILSEKLNIKKVSEQIREIQSSILYIRKQLPKMIMLMQNKIEKNIMELEQFFQSTVSKNRKQKNKEEQMKINAIMHIKNSEEKEHEKTRKQLKSKQKQFENYKKQSDSIIYQLRQQIWASKEAIDKLSISNQEYIKMHKELKSELSNKTKIMASQYQQKIKIVESNSTRNVQIINDKWKQQIRKLKDILLRIQSDSNEKQKLRQMRANKALQFFQKRQAREQDMKLIQNLQIQLIKKQFQLERQKQGLKEAKLELDNMDDIYKRIFYSASHHHAYNMLKHKNSGSFHMKKIKLPGIINRSTHPIKTDFE